MFQSLPRRSFGLSRWQTPGDDLFAEWQAHIDAGRIGVRQDHSAGNAAAEAWAAVVLGTPGRRKVGGAGAGGGGGAETNQAGGDVA